MKAKEIAAQIVAQTVEIEGVEVDGRLVRQVMNELGDVEVLCERSEEGLVVTGRAEGARYRLLFRRVGKVGKGGEKVARVGAGKAESVRQALQTCLAWTSDRYPRLFVWGDGEELSVAGTDGYAACIVRLPSNLVHRATTWAVRRPLPTTIEMLQSQFVPNDEAGLIQKVLEDCAGDKRPIVLVAGREWRKVVEAALLFGPKQVQLKYEAGGVVVRATDFKATVPCFGAGSEEEVVLSPQYLRRTCWSGELRIGWGGEWMRSVVVEAGKKKAVIMPIV